jgi:hypothetical protein
MAIQVELRGFRGAPVRGDLRKLAHDERLDVRALRFFVVEIGADVADMRIGEANDLAGITWIGENFLVAGETGVENDFAAAARDGAGSAAVKDAPVFERKSGGTMRNFGQFFLLILD